MLDFTDLNAAQREAVLHPEGPLVVYAGAGSGKTRVITYRVARILGDRPASSDLPLWDRAAPRVLAVTFTNKAALEMRERLHRLLGFAPPSIWVGTFHATCAKLLRLHAKEIGIRSDFVIYDESDQRAMVTRVLRDLGLDERRHPPKSLASQINRAKQEGLGPSDIPVEDVTSEIVKRVYEAYDERMGRSGALDFDDLIYRLVRAMESVPALGQALRSRFDHVLVDEFQDTNRVQLRLVSGLAQDHRNLCVVGDDDQSIYRWRGADRRNILDFRSFFPDATVVKLEQNYRSTQRILRAAYAVISKNVDREPKQLWTTNSDGASVSVVRCADERDEARMVARALSDLQLEGTSLSDMVVFYRTHAQSRVLEEALRSENLPYRVIGGTRFYDRAEVKDVLAYLRVLHNPDDDVSVLRILNTPTRGIGKTTVDRVLDEAAADGRGVFAAIVAATKSPNHAAGTRKKLQAFVQLIDGLREMAATPGQSLLSLGEAVLEQTGYARMLQAEDTAEADARLENLRELVGSMEEFDKEAENPNLASFLELVTLQTDVTSTLDVAHATLMTIHAAKGLEFPVVFVTGLEEHIFPFRGLDPWDDPDEMAEERRLAYVAFTRARKRLILSYAASRRLFGQLKVGQASRFIQELPADDIEVVATQAASRPSSPFFGSAPSPASPSSRRLASYVDPLRESPHRLPNESYVDRTEGTDSDGAELRLGMKVRHVKFGVGKVCAVSDSSPPKATVAFPGWGVKQIVLSYLEPA